MELTDKQVEFIERVLRIDLDTSMKKHYYLKFSKGLKLSSVRIRKIENELWNLFDQEIKERNEFSK